MRLIALALSARQIEMIDRTVLFTARLKGGIDWCVIGVRDMSEGLIDGVLRVEQTARGKLRHSRKDVAPCLNPSPDP